MHTDLCVTSFDVQYVWLEADSYDPFVLGLRYFTKHQAFVLMCVQGLDYQASVYIYVLSLY